MKTVIWAIATAALTYTTCGAILRGQYWVGFGLLLLSIGAGVFTVDSMTNKPWKSE